MSESASPIPIPSHTPSHSRACQNCAKSKAKCVYQSENIPGRCTRCERLGKDCIPVPRNIRKRRAPNTSTAKLEQKIESLVQLLGNVQSAGGVNQQVTRSESVSTDELPALAPGVSNLPPYSGGSIPLAPNTQHTSIHHEVPIASAPNVPTNTIHTTTTTTYNPSSTKQHFSSSIWNISDHEGDLLISKFRDVFLPHFPFIPISGSTSTREFKEKRPYVLKAIWTIANQDGRKRQIEMGKDFMVGVATGMLVRGDKSLDMLEGMLLMNAWSYFVSPLPPTSTSTAYYQLALALLYDLRLTKPMRETEGTADIIVDCKTRDTPDSVTNDTAKRTSDECRALLCCYYLGSVYAISIKRTEGLSFSNYIDFCCQTLEQRAECESDILLVALVRLECLIQPIDQLLTKKSSVDEHSAPIMMHIKAMRTNIDKFYNDLPLNIQQNSLMHISHLSTRIYIYEPVFYSSLFPSSPFVPSTQRLDLLHACLLASTSLFDIYLSRPLPPFYGTSLIDLAPLGRACTSLLRLCLLEDEPGWDLAEVRKQANLLDYLEGIQNMFLNVGEDLNSRQKELEGEDVRKSFFTGCSRAVGVIRGWYETKLAQESGVHDFNSYSRTGDGNESAGLGFDVNWLGAGGFLDEVHWSDFMGDWNF